MFTFRSCAVNLDELREVHAVGQGIASALGRNDPGLFAKSDPLLTPETGG